MSLDAFVPPDAPSPAADAPSCVDVPGSGTCRMVAMHPAATFVTSELVATLPVLTGLGGPSSIPSGTYVLTRELQTDPARVATRRHTVVFGACDGRNHSLSENMSRPIVPTDYASTTLTYSGPNMATENYLCPAAFTFPFTFAVDSVSGMTRLRTSAGTQYREWIRQP